VYLRRYSAHVAKWLHKVVDLQHEACL